MSMHGHRHSAKSKLKMSLSHRGKPTPWTAKLTAKQVVKIRKLYAGTGLPQAEIGRMFGVTRASVNNIVLGKTWKTI